ncbi:MAG: hypothetical protein KDC95_20225 [Planctomycetes bacterium]|nr:hypothetical protein [Planctomycetota bacterium]
MTIRSDEIRVDVGACMPGSVSAIERLQTALQGAGRGEVVDCPEAWVVPWVQQLQPGARLRVGSIWCLVDPFVHPKWRDVSTKLARLWCSRAEGATALPDSALGEALQVDIAQRAARVGLGIESRRLASKLARTLALEDLERIAPVVLPALHPVALGLDVDATLAGRGLLRDACRAFGIRTGVEPIEDPGIELPRRVKSLALGSDDFSATWSRSAGLRWRPGAAREGLDLFAIEVQADASPLDSFVALAPPRPRRFLASDAHPVRRGPSKRSVDAREWLRLEREFRFSADPSDPHGRKRIHDATLEVVLDRERRRLDVSVCLRGTLARHRYRLCVPLVHWPRPAKFTVGGSERAVEGPIGTTPVDGTIEFAGRETARSDTFVTIDGDDVIEAEVYPQRNDMVCALTLCRESDEALEVPCIERSFSISLSRTSPGS